METCIHKINNAWCWKCKKEIDVTNRSSSASSCSLSVPSLISTNHGLRSKKPENCVASQQKSNEGASPGNEAYLDGVIILMEKLNFEAKQRKSVNTTVYRGKQGGNRVVPWEIQRRCGDHEAWNSCKGIKMMGIVEVWTAFRLSSSATWRSAGEGLRRRGCSPNDFHSIFLYLRLSGS